MSLGRSGTDMPSWAYGDEKHIQLAGKDRLDLVAHIRSFQRIQIKY